MFLLKKVFQLRDKANPDAEKPFLEHLEDLRIMVTRIVITLLITTLGCFAYRDKLMEILREPIGKVWEIHSANKLPKTGPINADTWEKAKEGTEAMAHLPVDFQRAYLDQLSVQERELVAVASCYRAAITLPKEKQGVFVKAQSSLSEEQKSLLDQLIELKPDAIAGTRDKFKFMSSLNPSEAFMLSMKLAFFAGIVVAFPLLLLFILQFIMPGLHKHEKNAIYPALVVGFGLFLCGVMFAYFWVLPSVLEFFYSYGESMGIANEWRIGYYLSFATQFTLIFGVCFELPVVVWVLVKIGLLHYELMSRTRGYAMIAIVIIAAVITPTPDGFTLCLLAVPMMILYEISIWIAWYDARIKKRAEDKEEKERLEKILNSPAPPAKTPEETTEPTAENVTPEMTETEEGEEPDVSDPHAHPEKTE